MQVGVCILGSTGSIGSQTLDVIRSDPQSFEVVSLAANSQIDLLIDQAKEFKPKFIVVGNDNSIDNVKSRLTFPCEVMSGALGLKESATNENVDIVLGAISGFAGLEPTLSAVKAGKAIALANKESLVAGGEYFMNEVKKSGTLLCPVDSEHSSLFQCLNGRSSDNLRRMVLTASGGPFLNYPIAKLSEITPEQAVKHPRWDMGAKISVDSATLFNKGLEVIEACYLFSQPVEKMGVFIHPQSIVHGLLEYNDGTVLAAMFETDMRIPIAYALYNLKSRLSSINASSNIQIERYSNLLDLTEKEPLEFKSVEFNRFPALSVCLDAMGHGKSYPIVLNAANEVAVAAFLDRNLGFCEIIEVVKDTLNMHNPYSVTSFEDIVDIDQIAREQASDIINRKF